MKTLILTCNTGEGHNSVSAAVQEVFLSRHETCDVVDGLGFLSQRASEFISNWHVRIYRYIPKAFRVGYRYTEGHRSIYEENTAVDKLLASGAERLYAYIVGGGYDCVICPHVITGVMVTHMLREYPMPHLRTCFVATDYTCSPMAEQSELDWFFAPDQATVPEFLAAGIPSEHLAVMHGVPVRGAFYQITEKLQAKRQLGIAPTSKHLLMMCGSMGCGPMGELTELLAAQLPEEDLLTVCCGTNKRLLKKLERQFSAAPNVRLLGFTDQIGLLMDSADLYLTKPGGISTSEAAVKALPMVLVDAVAGCEEYNLRHFCGLGGAVTADTPQELTTLCLTLLQDDARRQQMSDSLRSDGSAADDIYVRMTQPVNCPGKEA